MSDTKYRPSLLDRRFHSETVFQACGHWLLTENVVSLLSKRQSDLQMHMIMHSNDDGIGEAFTNGADGLRRSGM